MFSAAANPYDEIVGKATDENLASEDWALNIEVCDKVSGDGSTGARNAVGALQKRLTHRNPNVQLYALELANTLAQNCGKPLLEELSSRGWTGALERLVNDRSTAKPVKKKALGFIKAWAKQFEDTGDRNLGLMSELYDNLRRKDPMQFDDPEPVPQSRTQEDRRRQQEDEELQRVLELSKQDKGGRNPPAASTTPSNAYASASRPTAGSSSYVPPAVPMAEPEPEIPDLETATRVRALYTFSSVEIGELTFERGDVIKVLDRGFKEWWRGACNGKIGIFPTTYVEAMPEPTVKELQDEAQEEARVFASLGLVDQLLQTLKSIDPERGDRIDGRQDIEEMYQASVALQGQINTLIKKYSDQKAELEHMNANFTRAMRQYEELKNGTLPVPQPYQQQYGGQPSPTGPGPNGYDQQQQYGQYPGQQPPHSQYYGGSQQGHHAADQQQQPSAPNTQWPQAPAPLGPHDYQTASPDPTLFQQGPGGPSYPQQGPSQPPQMPQQQAPISPHASTRRASYQVSPSGERPQSFINTNLPPQSMNGQPGQPYFHNYNNSSTSLNKAPAGAPDLPPDSPRRQKTQSRPGAAGIGAGQSAGSENDHGSWDQHQQQQPYYQQQPPAQGYGGLPQQQPYGASPYAQVGQGAPPQGRPQSWMSGQDRQSSYGSGNPGPAGGMDRVTSGMNRMSVHGQ